MYANLLNVGCTPNSLLEIVNSLLEIGTSEGVLHVFSWDA